MLDAQKAVLLGAFTEWRKSPLDRGYNLKAAIEQVRGATRRRSHRPAVRPRADQAYPACGRSRAIGGGRARGLHRLGQALSVTGAKRALAGAGLAIALAFAFVLSGLLAGCGESGSPLAAPINSPYERGAERSSTLFTAFTERSPRYLDPTASYSINETPYVGFDLRAAVWL